MTNTSRPDAPLLAVRDVHTTFPIKSKLLQRTIGHVQAVSGVSFELSQGETLGLVGESGSGKSTIARTIIGLTEPAAGEIYFEGRDLATLPVAERTRMRRDIQMIFQDPYSSLNPRRTVRQIVSEPWEINRGIVPEDQWATRVGELLEHVGLNPDHADRYPHQFSGGQCQRIGIARALALRPKMIICDEPVSALDVSIQAQVLNLLSELQDEFGLTYLFIAHDLSVVRHISDRVAVMYLGKIVEMADREELFTQPTHPYTQALLSAVPVPKPWEVPDRRRRILAGDTPSPADPPSGCRFRTRCWKAEHVCAVEEPVLEPRRGGHSSACHFAESDDSVAV
jgi:oligopeptide transport system ATP-binding protein